MRTSGLIIESTNAIVYRRKRIHLSMTVYVKVWGILRQYHPGPDRSQVIPVSLAAGATVAELRRSLDMPPQLVNRAIAYLGDEVVPPEHILADGDLLNLAPAVAGG